MVIASPGAHAHGRGQTVRGQARFGEALPWQARGLTRFTGGGWPSCRVSLSINPTHSHDVAFLKFRDISSTTFVIPYSPYKCPSIRETVAFCRLVPKGTPPPAMGEAGGGVVGRRENYAVVRPLPRPLPPREGS